MGFLIPRWQKALFLPHVDLYGHSAEIIVLAQFILQETLVVLTQVFWIATKESETGEIGR